MNGDKGSEIELLKKYEEILSFPMNKRKKSIREMSPFERSDFWKAQMIYHLATAKLNEAQREFIAGTIPFLTVNAFDFPVINEQPRNEETKTLDSLQPKAFELFSREEMFAIFMGYGIHKEVPPTKNFDVQPMNAPICDCNYYCGVNTLYCSSASCNRSNFGCGWYGDQSCSSLCR